VLNGDTISYYVGVDKMGKPKDHKGDIALGGAQFKVKTSGLQVCLCCKAMNGLRVLLPPSIHHRPGPTGIMKTYSSHTFS
jgi:hypothetical protein